jgi:hypothetical protein
MIMLGRYVDRANLQNGRSSPQTWAAVVMAAPGDSPNGASPGRQAAKKGMETAWPRVRTEPAFVSVEGEKAAVWREARTGGRRKGRRKSAVAAERRIEASKGPGEDGIKMVDELKVIVAGSRRDQVRKELTTSQRSSPKSRSTT